MCNKYLTELKGRQQWSLSLRRTRRKPVGSVEPNPRRTNTLSHVYYQHTTLPASGRGLLPARSPTPPICPPSSPIAGQSPLHPPCLELKQTRIRNQAAGSREAVEIQPSVALRPSRASTTVSWAPSFRAGERSPADSEVSAHVPHRGDVHALVLDQPLYSPLHNAGEQAHIPFSRK